MFQSSLSLGFWGKPGASAHAAFMTAVWWNLFFLIGASQGHQGQQGLEDRREIRPLLILTNIGFGGLWLESVLPALVADGLWLAVQLPLWLFLHSLGGLTITELLAAIALLASFAVLATNVLFLVSLFVHKSKSLMQWTLLLLFLLLGLPWVLPKGLAALRAAGIGGALLPQLEAQLQWLSQYTLPGGIDRLGLRTSGESAWAIVAIPILVNLLLAAALCAIARWSFPLVYTYAETEADAESKSTWAFWMGRLTSRLTRIRLKPQETSVARPRTWDAPRALEWKSWRYVTGGPGGRSLRRAYYGLATMLFLVGGAVVVADLDDHASFPVMMGLGGVMTVAGVIIESCYVLSAVLNQELAGQTASSLMLLPLETPELVTKLYRGAWGSVALSWCFLLGNAVIMGIALLLVKGFPQVEHFWSGAGFVALGLLAVVTWLAAFAAVCVALSISMKQRFAAVPLAYFAQYVMTMALIGVLIICESKLGLRPGDPFCEAFNFLFVSLAMALEAWWVWKSALKRFAAKAAES